MPYFTCRMATENGQIFSQSLLAASPAECRKLFESEGYCVLSVRKDWRRINLPSLPFEKKIKDKDFIWFNQDLTSLIRAGYPILKSIEIITGRVKNIHLKELLMKVEGDIRAGKSLSEAFLPFERNFSKVYIASLMAGEQSGNLAGTIGRYIQYAKVISQTRTRIRTALMYPTLLLVFSFILIAILITFILPRFSSFYADFGAELPIITQALIAFSLAVRRFAPFLIILAVLLGVGFYRMKKGEKTTVILDRIKLRIPYARTLWLETGVSLFSRTLSLLLEAGITLLSSIGIASQAIPNKYLVQSTKHLPESLKNGESLSESLAKAKFFTPLSLDMVRIGETSANLHGMLSEVADVYDERIRSRIDTLVHLLEPVIIIFMGILIAAMLLSVYLPIFNIIRITR